MLIHGTYAASGGECDPERFNTPQEERIWRAKERAAAEAGGRHPRRPREEKLFGIGGNLDRGFHHDPLKDLIECGAGTGNSPNVLITYNDKPGLREEVQRRWKVGCWHVFEANMIAQCCPLRPTGTSKNHAAN